MGGLCGKSSTQEEKHLQQRQPYFAQASHEPQQLNRPQEKKVGEGRSTEDERARMDEARSNAAIAAQKRAEIFEKSAGGRAARTAIAAAKANPASTRNEPGLKWTVG